MTQSKTGNKFYGILNIKDLKKKRVHPQKKKTHNTLLKKGKRRKKKKEKREAMPVKNQSKEKK